MTDEQSRGVDRRLLGLIALATVFGLGHHVDHLIRGNHVGWPASPEVNAFTFSLLIYPVIVVGLYLTLSDRVGVRYWMVVAGAGLAMLAGVHFGPWAIEPPADIVDPYRPSNLGYVALAWLLVFLGVLLAAFGYAGFHWRGGSQGDGGLEELE